MRTEPETAGNESVEALRRRVEELERWFERQDRQIRFLERERQKLSALVNHTDAGFLVFGPDLTVRWLNNVCRGWFGDAGPPLPGRAATCNAVLCRSSGICAACPVAAALDQAAVSHREMRLALDATERHIYATAMPIRAPDNRVDECILMLQDITDLEVLRCSQEALLRAKELAESANRAKSEFLANMSHEVRTPMTGILSMSRHLQDTGLTADQQECATIIQSCGESLLTILNDILDISRIEAGRVTIDALPFDPAATIDEVVGLFAARAAEKDLELIVRYAPNLPARVVGDAGRIRQALMNLVGNAIKFTHAGHVLVDVERRGGDATQAELRFSVEDTGIGIPADKLGCVFEKFTQADGSITRRYGGTGLGLAISKHLVELMGGEIGVTSVESRGSTFHFTLALPLDAGAPPAAPDFGGLRILVVHPYERLRDVLVEGLASWRAAVLGVADGGAALAALRAAHAAGAPIRLALVAGELPDGPPETLAQAIRDDPVLRAVGLVLLSTLGQRRDAERLLRLGFDAYHSRPALPADLHRALSQVVERRAG